MRQLHAYPLILLATLGTGLGAAEREGTSSVRLAYELPPEEYDIEVDTELGGSSDEGDYDENHRITAELLCTHGMFAFGGGAFYQTSEDEVLGADYDLERFGGFLQAGAVLPLGQLVRLELLPFAGLGHARLQPDDSEGDDDSDFYFEYGARLNAVVAAGRSFEVGVGIGYLISEAEFDYSVLGSGVTTTVEDEGVFYRAFVGVRL